MVIDFKPKYEYRIYVPTDKLHADHCDRIVRECGGITMHYTVGSWQGSESVITQPVTVVSVIADGRDTPESIMELREYLLGRGEEAVLITRSTIETHGI